MQYLKQSTVFVFRIGPFVDKTDGATAETGLTIAQADIQISKAGAAFAQTSDASPTTTHDTDGWYQCPLTATDTGTLGTLDVQVNMSADALPVWRHFTVLPANVFDSLVSGSDNLEVDTVAISGDGPAADNLESAADGGSYNLGGGGVVAASVTGAVGSVTGAVGSVTGSVGSVTGAVGSVTGSVGSVVGHTAQTGDSFARLGAPAGASVSADVAAVKTDTAAILIDTAEIGAAGAGLTAVPYNASWDAEIQSECNDALVALGLDHLVGAAVIGTDVVDNSIVAKLVSASATADWDDFVNTTDALQAIRDRGDAAWTTGAGGSDRLLMVDTTIATLSSQTSFTLTAGSADDDAYNGMTIVIEDAATSTQKAVGIVSDYTGATKTVTLLYDPAVFTMATTDKVYILAEASLKASAANRQLDVTATGAAGIDWGNVENPTTAVDLSATDIQLCDTITTYTGNTVQTGDAFARLGAPAGASVSADVAAVKAETALIVADTNELQTDWVDGGRLDLIVDAILVDTGTTIPGTITTVDTNVDSILALLDNARTEPGQGAPPVNPDLATKIDYLYKAWRNKTTQTTTTLSLFADDATTVDHKATVSDDGTTTTIGEMATGP